MLGHGNAVPCHLHERIDTVVPERPGGSGAKQSPLNKKRNLYAGDVTLMQSLEVGNTSPTDLKLRRRSRRYLSAPRAYLSSIRRRLATRDFDTLRSRLLVVVTRTSKILLAVLAVYVAWIVLVVLYEIFLGLLIVEI